jgi:uncharacterized protein YbaP (TraB family)
MRRLASLLVVLLCATTAPAAQGSHSFLWKVQSGPRVLYLAGSVHALSADVYPLAPAFQRAFDASGTLVEEIDLAEADSMAALPMLMAKGMYTDGRTFDQAVSKETAALVAARLGAVPGLSELLKPMKPWVVTLMLEAISMQSAGLDAALGLTSTSTTWRTRPGNRSRDSRRRRRRSIASTGCRSRCRSRCCARPWRKSMRATQS